MNVRYCGFCGQQIVSTDGQCHCVGAINARNAPKAGGQPQIIINTTPFPDSGVYPTVTREEFEELKRRVEELEAAAPKVED